MGKVAGGRQPLTYDDFVLFPDDGKRHELIEGQHHVTPSPVPRHQRISGAIHFQLYDQIDRPGLGQVFSAPIDVVLDDTNVVVPDLVVVLDGRRAVIGEKNIRGAPDLVVEITSPGTRARDLGAKRALYERAGVPEYWLVLAGEDTVRQLVLEDGAYRDRGCHSETIEFRGLPGVTVDLARTW